MPSCILHDKTAALMPDDFANSTKQGSRVPVPSRSSRPELSNHVKVRYSPSPCTVACLSGPSSDSVTSKTCHSGRAHCAQAHATSDHDTIERPRSMNAHWRALGQGCCTYEDVHRWRQVICFGARALTLQAQRCRYHGSVLKRQTGDYQNSSTDRRGDDLSSCSSPSDKGTLEMHVYRCFCGRLYRTCDRHPAYTRICRKCTTINREISYPNMQAGLGLRSASKAWRLWARKR